MIDDGNNSFRGLPARLAFALIVVFVVGCDRDLPGKPNPANRPVLPEKVLDFTLLFDQNCAGCHGPNGRQGAAPPLNDNLFRALAPVEQLGMTIGEGRSGTPMPAFARSSGGTLTDDQVQVLVNGIKGVPGKTPKGTSSDAAKTEPPWGAVAPAPRFAPPYLQPEEQGNAAKGFDLFARARATCHGANGEGVVQGDERRNSINEPAFLALMSDQAIRRIIITGRSDLKMPDYSQKTGRPADFQPLTSNDIADLTALLAKLATSETEADAVKIEDTMADKSEIRIDDVTRRTFFQRFGLWITGAVGLLAAVAFALPVFAYFLGPLRRRTAPWVDLGPVNKFPKNETRMATFDNPLRQEWDGITAQTGVYVRYLGKDTSSSDQFLVLGINCAHLGCPVSWFPHSGLFMCPCHGGGYYKDGRHASGPPPRGLYHCVWRVNEGKLEVQAPHYPTLQNTLKGGSA